MKKATKRILEEFPILEDKISAHENIFLTEEAVKSLSDVERTFLKMIWFFESPEEVEFNLNQLYKYLEDDWLEFALESVAFFFREDTYLIKEPSLSIVKESDDYFNQIQFADYLSRNGLKYDRAKLNVYYKRGNLPKADIILANKPYWRKSTVQSFCEEEKRNQND